jgi:glycosyltransferase involved in cell wall biosynthesis
VGVQAMNLVAGRRRKRMLVLCPFPQGVAAGQRLKYEQYFDDWRANGFEIDVSPFMDMAMWSKAYAPGHYGAKIWGTIKGYLRRFRDMFRVGQYDVVYVFMWVTPLGPSFSEWLTRALAAKLVFDVEDNVLTEQLLPKSYNPNYLVSLIKGRGKAKYLIAAADHVVTSSPFLNDYCLDINRKRQCTYISSSIDTDRFLPVNAYANDRVVTVGWTGTFSSKIYLDMLRGVFQELAKRVKFKLKLITNFDYELDGVDLEVVRWTSEKEVEDLQTFDIGVYPLPIDDWVLGKSGLKAIQYMAFGLPAIATEVGTTPLIIRHGQNGMLVKTDEDWLNALETLIRDPQMRRRLGEAARQDAVAKYSTKAIAGQYRHILKSLTEPDHEHA